MSARAWAGFFAMSTIWGVPYLFIKVAVDDGVPPAFLAWSRVVLAAVVLLALAWRAGSLASLRGRGRWLLAFAVFEITVPFPAIAFGEQHVDSSVAAIIIAAAPLIVALLALRFDASERVSGRRLRPARDDGGEPRDRGRAADPVRGGAAARGDAAARGGRRAARPRPRLHGRRVRHLLRPDRRDRARSCARDHVRRAGRRGRARRGRPRRAPGRRRRRGPPAHHRGLVAVDRRAAAAGAERG